VSVGGDPKIVRRQWPRKVRAELNAAGVKKAETFDGSAIHEHFRWIFDKGMSHYYWGRHCVAYKITKKKKKQKKKKKKKKKTKKKTKKKKKKMFSVTVASETRRCGVATTIPGAISVTRHR